MRLAIQLVAAIAMLAGVGACTPLATWPPTEGRQPLVPHAPPCPQLMATAVSFTRSKTDQTAPLVFNLPPKTEWTVWAEVQRLLGADARMMQPSDPWAFTVQQVRLDGGKAEVDVAYRTSEGIWQLATVHFTGAFGGNYRPNYFQRWVIPVDAPTCNTPPPPPPKADTGGGPAAATTSSGAATAPSDSSSTSLSSPPSGASTAPSAPPSGESTAPASGASAASVS